MAKEVIHYRVKNQCDISNQVAVEPGAVACFFLLNFTGHSR
jgi:hypothetical protein